MLLLALLACEPDLALDTDAPLAPESTAVALSMALQGRFDSQAQAAMDEQYSPMERSVCPVEIPELGSSVLYVQHRQAGRAVHDQSLWVLEDGARDTTVRVRLFEPEQRGVWVDFCDELTVQPPQDAAWTERDACGLHFVRDAAADSFRGSTVGTECETSLIGDYQTTEVSVTADGADVWNRGFHRNGGQAWGFISGGYEFDRLD